MCGRTLLLNSQLTYSSASVLSQLVTPLWFLFGRFYRWSDRLWVGRFESSAPTVRYTVVRYGHTKLALTIGEGNGSVFAFAWKLFVQTFRQSWCSFYFYFLFMFLSFYFWGGVVDVIASDSRWVYSSQGKRCFCTWKQNIRVLHIFL